MSAKVLSSSVKNVSENVMSKPLLLLSVLGVVVVVIVLFFFVKSRHIDSFESFPAPFETMNSVYSSFPDQKKDNNGWNYLSSFGESCMASGEDGKCGKNRKFNIKITPHNQRVEYWE